MAKQATFEIVINGVKESIAAVDSLNKSLDALEQRIDALAKKNINVSTSGVKSGTDTNELKQEEALLKKIDQLHKKVAETEKKEYQELLHAKEELKEYQQIAKSIAAETNLSQGINDTNTMAGMKAQLHDIKAAMQFVDVDSDKFKQMQKDANDLNNRLKEIEQGYGQYGRSVGNYANGVAEGMQKVRVQVGDTVREFNSARDASRTLNNELKAMALNGQQDTQAYKDLNEAVKQVNSTIEDTKRSSVMMDNLLDTMESLSALATAGVGLSSLFGLEDSGFEETMKKLAALYAVLKSFETLNKQWKSGEGLMGGLKTFFKNADEVGAEYGEKFGKKWSEAFQNTVEKIVSKFYEHDFDKMMKKGEEGIYEASEKLYNTTIQSFRYINKEKKLEGNEKLFSDEEITRFATQAKNQLEIMFEAFDKGVARMHYGMEMATQQWNKGWKTLVSITRGGAKFIANTFKLLSKAIVGTLTAGLALALPEILNWFGDLAKSFKTAENAAEKAAESLNALNRELEAEKDILSSLYLKGTINDEEYLSGIYKAQSVSLKEQINLIQKRAEALQKNASGWGRIFNAFGATQNTEFSGKDFVSPTTVGSGRLTSFWQGSENDLQVTVNDLFELEDAWKTCSEAIKNNQDYFDQWQDDVEDKSWWSSVKAEFNSWWATVKDTEDVMRGLGNIRLSSLISDFQRVNEQFSNGEIKAEEFKTELERLRNEMNHNEILNSVIANLDKYIPDEKVRTAVQNIINEIYRLDDAFNMTSPEQIHYWNQVRIDAMKDGYAKEMAQIQENERYEIQQKAYTEEQKTLLQKKYDRQRQNARDKANKDALSKAKEHGKKLQDAENELIALRIENMKEGLDKELAQIENERRLAIQKARESGTKSGEIIMQINLKYDQKILDQKRKWAAEIIKIYEDMLARIEQVNKQTFEIEVETATQNTEMKQSEALRKSGYEMITPSTYDDTKALEAYYKKVMDIEKKYLDIQTEIQRESLDKQLDYTKAEEELRHRRATDPNDNEFLQQLRAGKITQEEYDKLIEDENTAHTARMNAIDKKYASDLKKLTEDNLQDTLGLYTDYFDKIVKGVAEERAKIDEVVSQPLILDNDGWDIVDIGKNRQRFKQALSQYEELKKGIIEKQKELKNALDTSGITAEDFAIEQKALDDEMKAIDNAVTNIKQSSKSLLGDFFQSIQQYVQAVGQAATSIIQSIGEINDAAFDKQMEALDKQSEALEKQLDKQKELTQKYADDVDSIEDELATARGDRRQHLIDQLNAQMAAQRESLAQEKRIEKEQERIDRKKKDLEYQNEVRKWEQSKLTAAINAALAISNAAVNKWPIPAIPMMALATAVGAAQMAAVAAAKPKKYAEGGLLQGKSHAQGGIKAMGGKVELEGDEFVVNKKTTMQNLPLMHFINSKKKKIDISDMIDFYSSGIKKNISIPNKTKFADGGVIPTLRSDVDLEGNVLRAIEKYNERNVVVSVVDIINKSDNIKQVQALAGI